MNFKLLEIAISKNIFIFIVNARRNIFITFCFVKITLSVQIWVVEQGMKLLILVAQKQMKKNCSCKTGLSHEVCGFCLSARYILNFKCFKICDVKFVKQVPLHPRERLQRKRKSTLEITAV